MVQHRCRLKVKPLPPLDPQERTSRSPDKTHGNFRRLIEQEVSDKQLIRPEEVLKVYLKWRPTPLVRARGLEALLETPVIFNYKNESVSPAGSHKPILLLLRHISARSKREASFN